MTRLSTLLILLIACADLGLANDAPPRPRSPVALAITPDGQRLFVANRGTGSVAVVDTAERRVVAEHAIGATLSDLARSADGRLLATDERSHQLIIVNVVGDELQVRSRVDVPPYPVAVRPSADGRRAFVASLWSRRLTRVDWMTDPPTVRTLDLPFAPRRLIALDQAGKVVVADAFGGHYAVVDAAAWTLDSNRRFQAHNIAGMAAHPDGKRLVITHQGLNRAARSTADDIHWGFLVANSLRWVLVDDLLDPARDPADRGLVTSLGRPGDGGGDPGAVAIAPDGTAVVPLAGVGRVVVGNVDEPVRLRLAAGKRPTAVVLSPDARRAYVANTDDDSITVIDVAQNNVVATIPLGAKAELTEVERGERLFHDARLSQEGWMSCQSCHGQGHSNHRVADTLGDESYGAPKRVPSLLGVGLSAPYAWNGQMPDLAAQVRKSTQTTMRGRPLADDEVAALVAYMRSLAPAPSVDRLRGTLDETRATRGAAVFRERCERCHAGPARTDGKEHDVGLTDEDGNRRFNTPSLLGVSQRDRLLHDGRHASLEDLLIHDRHPRDGLPLSESEAADLIAYLRGL